MISKAIRVHSRSSAAKSSELRLLHTEIAACRKCAEAGFFAHPSPIVVNQPVIRPKMMLVGQAPASPLRSKGKPFSGQAGRVLFAWLGHAGFSEDEFRAQCYFTAITKCYPGPAKPLAPKGEFGVVTLLGVSSLERSGRTAGGSRSPSRSGSGDSPLGVGGKGDRVPSATERALCEPYLLRELAIMKRAAKSRGEPLLIITVGRISTAYFLGNNINFTEAIGQSFAKDDCLILPLPHPSGVSRWTNDPQNQIRLERALTLLKSLMHASST